MKSFIITLVAFSFNFLVAQKIVEKSVLNDHISLININTENCYEVTIETTNTNDVTVSATIDGEYQKDLLLEIKEEASSIFISTGFSPTFTNPNDKLSAHKVISISLHIVLPNYKNVRMYGKSSNITASGKYNNIDISLSDGYCVLKSIEETVAVTTQSGNITVESNNANITAKSKYGAIVAEKLTKGDIIFNLSTITGNIHISKTK
ncbi:DUF4097 family beta strand repeat-containing protein [Cellulophaga sp. 20_2_10]|uniref:DUF4097 family beta strand repeat-containing protein n=1 Tax=Cellulophaga sp. 20_2_10 TaxID=2942476 RepID=UPI00201B312A|nr:DUF4097 family beta strand repeat-containing protein [Cellulophaga sp. 20_2_10]MCL5246318.1 DUF4097 family beta strand repeat-containing protein [Cellulophaga sp. 20_2_10]